MDRNTTDAFRREPDAPGAAGTGMAGTAGTIGTGMSGITDTGLGAGLGADADLAGGTGTDSRTMTLSQERLVAVAQSTPREVVRITKHVVTEERTINVQVQVRREELRVERLPAGSGRAGAAGVGAAATAGAPVLTLVLSEEVPEVAMRVVPREQVTVYVDRTTEQVPITATLRREELDVQTTGSADAATRDVTSRGTGV